MLSDERIEQLVIHAFRYGGGHSVDGAEVEEVIRIAIAETEAACEKERDALRARLEELLASAVVGEEKESDGSVQPGNVITLTMNGKEQTFLLGSPEISEGTELDVFSPDSPIGQAITGLKIGEETSYAAPNGKLFEVKIINVSTYVG